MDLIKNKLTQEPENVARSAFLELAKQDDRKIPQPYPANNPVHRVKLIRGEEGRNKNTKTQKEVDGIWLFFEEDGIEKKYFVPQKYNDKNDDKYGKFYYLFERFADIEEGTWLDMEFVKKGMTGFIDVRPVAPTISDTTDIPVIEDNSDVVDVKDIPF